MGRPHLAALETDGWCIDDGEVAHAKNPGTFEIPALHVRSALNPGDTAKLRFYIRVATEDGEVEDFGERMWVEVKGQVNEWYRGELLNQPSCTPDIRPGWEVWFLPRHVLDVQTGQASSVP